MYYGGPTMGWRHTSEDDLPAGPGNSIPHPYPHLARTVTAAQLLDGISPAIQQINATPRTPTSSQPRTLALSRCDLPGRNAILVPLTFALRHPADAGPPSSATL